MKTQVAEYEGDEDVYAEGSREAPAPRGPGSRGASCMLELVDTNKTQTSMPTFFHLNQSDRS
jgi:hypothetical protein